MRVYAFKFFDQLLHYTLFLYIIIITLYIILYNNQGWKKSWFFKKIKKSDFFNLNRIFFI